MTKNSLEETCEALTILLEAGPWPVPAIVELMLAAGYTRRTVERAAALLKEDGRLVLVQARYWVTPANAPSSLFIEGFSRERLVAPLLPKQGPTADPSDVAREERLDEITAIIEGRDE